MVKLYDATTSDGKGRLTIWGENPPPPDVIAFWESGQPTAARFEIDEEGRLCSSDSSATAT